MTQFKIISKKEFLKKNKKPSQEKIWNEIASSWKTYVVKKIQVVEEFLNNKKGKIIDMGCGAGRNFLPVKGIEYYGVDFSKNQLKNARKYVKINKIKARIYKSKLDNLNKKIFRDNIFDYGLFIGSLHCLETEKERLDSLKELYRVLKHKAEALISVWNYEDKRFSQIKNKEVYMSWKKERIIYMRYYYLYNKKEFLDLLKSVGFNISEFYKSKEHNRFSKKNWIVRVRKD